MQYTHEFETACGRVFDISVVDVKINHQDVNMSTYDSDIDFYGFTEVEFDIGVVEEILEDGSPTIIQDLEKVLSIEEWDDCMTDIEDYIRNNLEEF